MLISHFTHIPYDYIIIPFLIVPTFIGFVQQIKNVCVLNHDDVDTCNSSVNMYCSITTITILVTSIVARYIKIQHIKDEEDKAKENKQFKIIFDNFDESILIAIKRDDGKYNLKYANNKYLA